MNIFLKLFEMRSDKEILEALVTEGLINVSLGVLIMNSKSQSSIGALAGTVLFATLEANKNARKTNIPLILKEKNALYEVKADGSKRFIKNIPKITRKVPKKFTLK